MHFSILRKAIFGILVSLSLANLQAADHPKLHRTVAKTPEDLRTLFSHSEEKMPLISAHRGGAIPGFPENCIATFEQTLKHAYSILEIDLRFSQEGEIVLLHDSTLDRTTTGSGPVSDLSLDQLKRLHLKDNKGTVTEFRIPTLDETIDWARGKTILILDKKNVPIERCVQEIQKHAAQSFVMIMVSSMEHIQTIHQLDPDIMMEVFLGTEERFKAFEKTGVPWDRIIPFISHQPIKNWDLVAKIHAKGTSCMAGTSRYLDLELTSNEQASPELASSYQRLLDTGIDIIETDLPIQVSQILFRNAQPPKAKSKHFELR